MTIIERALNLWGLDGGTTNLIAARENAVYHLEHPSGHFALRLHRQRYRTDDQLLAELDWMDWVAASGLSVPKPLASLNGQFLHSIDGIQVDILTWLRGETLDVAIPSMDMSTLNHVFRALGRDMARLHDASDAWPQGKTCNRPAWNVDGLLGPTPLWDRFWDNPALTPKQIRLFDAFRTKAKTQLSDLAPTLDYGLIHADLVPANVMKDGNTLHFIDFDDGGFGFRLFEVATALLKLRSHPNFTTLKSALISGYASQRPLALETFDLFLALRAATYVGWNITRSSEDASGERNARFISEANDTINIYLDS